MANRLFTLFTKSDLVLTRRADSVTDSELSSSLSLSLALTKTTSDISNLGQSTIDASFVKRCLRYDGPLRHLGKFSQEEPEK